MLTRLEIYPHKDGGIVNMCDVAERLERNGMAKGEENLADAIRALKSGVTKEELLSKGFNPNTIKLAEEFV